jgi:CheY-like chemotaxis protein
MACAIKPEEEQPNKQPLTVLVVEDEFFIRLSTADEIRAAGYRVVEAVNANEAEQILRSGTKIDLVFSDVQMPGPMDGIALARLVRDRHPATRIVLTSAHPAPVCEVDHDGFFRKPYEFSKLIETLERLLSEGRWDAPARCPS